MITKVIILDIDGPMIPSRAGFLPSQTAVPSIFDPVAVSLLLRLVELSNSRIVISSTHGNRGYNHIRQLFEINGIDVSVLHPDWITPKTLSSYRIHEIKWWLDNHPEVTSYVAIDDEQLDIRFVPNSVQCDAHEGFSFRNFLECCLYLDAFDESSNDVESQRQEAKRLVWFLKRKEIWRTFRCGEPNQHRVWEIADDMLPPI